MMQLNNATEIISKSLIWSALLMLTSIWFFTRRTQYIIHLAWYSYPVGKNDETVGNVKYFKDLIDPHFITTLDGVTSVDSHYFRVGDGSRMEITNDSYSEIELRHHWGPGWIRLILDKVCANSQERMKYVHARAKYFVEILESADEGQHLLGDFFIVINAMLRIFSREASIIDTEATLQKHEEKITNLP